MGSHDRQYWATNEAQARAISTALGQGWIARDASAHTEYRNWHLRRLEDGLELDLSWDDAYTRERHPTRVRLSIQGVWPRDHDQQVCVPTLTERAGHKTQITVDATKPAETIAKAIQSRLLSGFTLLHRRAMDIVNSRDAYQHQTEATLAAILAAIPGSYRGQNAKASIYFRSDNHAYTVSAQGDSVRFESFSCPLPAAIEALKALSEAAAQAAHEADDPHCTCPDCIETHAAQVPS